eukprot:5328913-Pyramimonas_sp.AAC.1
MVPELPEDECFQSAADEASRDLWRSVEVSLSSHRSSKSGGKPTVASCASSRPTPLQPRADGARGGHGTKGLRGPEVVGPKGPSPSTL